ncbi:hypothetical protein ACSBL2_14600 [Pedobacter sp. AW31-3R]|uniref:hypothetical protein n=1 Tax=Pedobacter sp. AW31-3R TaxID=3445781 RepID=UPI003FA097A0
MIKNTLLLQITHAGYLFIAIIILLIVLFKIWPKEKRNKTLLSLFFYLFFGLGAILLLVLLGGMGYFVYLRLFTHEKDEAPLWAVLLCIFFLSVMVLVVVGQLFKGKTAHKEGKTDFDDLQEALLTPHEVIRLNLVAKGLTRAPEDLLKFNNLISLDLSNNQLDTLPLKLAGLKHLASVKLSNNPISDEERSKIRRAFPPELELIFRN